MKTKKEMTEETPIQSRKRSNFFLWYYNEGIQDLLEIYKNVIFFGWRYFSVKELFLTLFSPWHRDVEIRDWRGWNPIRWAKVFLENFFSCLMGAIVRLIVIMFGIAFSLVVFVCGIVIVLFWIFVPYFFLALIFSLLSGHANLLVAEGLFLWTIFVIACYFHDAENSLSNTAGKELAKQRGFERICNRLGFTRKNFPVEILENEEMLKDFLKSRNISQAEYARIIAWEARRQKLKKDAARFWSWEQLKKIIPIGRQWRFGYTVNLDRYGSDLSDFDSSEYAKAVLVGRNNEREILKLILTRPDQNCALLVGDAGIGKKTLIHCLAQEIRTGQADGSFADVRIVLFDLGRFISDAINHRQDIENQLRVIFYEAAYAGNVILVIENLEHYLGGEGNLLHPDISAVLVDAVSDPSLRLIATSTPAEYHQLIEKKQQIVKYFEVIEVSQPTDEETIQIMLGRLEKYEQKRVLFTYEALRAIVKDSSRDNWSVPLPERALDLMMDVLTYWEKKSEEWFLTEKTIDEYLTLKTGVKRGEIDSSERKKLLKLEETFHRQVIGQEEAVSQVAEALRRTRSGVGDLQKPVGSFLFLGPTGVGKTETAKALAKIYFGDEKKMIRLDMSEFQTPNSIDRLLGSSQLNQQGRLVTQIKDNPHSLLLLDEIEKAYPEILDIFLQILDEGFVTDAFGEKINFRNCLIVATSNAGAVLIKKMVENQAPADQIKAAIVDWTVENNIFKVEFLNRFDGVIFFRPLSQSELVSVVQLKLRNFARRLDKEKNIQIGFRNDVVRKIIQRGYNPIFGARSLNRYIEDTVENLVAEKIISGEAVSGEKIIIEL